MESTLCQEILMSDLGSIVFFDTQISSESGRGLIATEDIHRGSVIFQDQASALIPSFECRLQICYNCTQQLDSHYFVGSSSWRRFCSEECFEKQKVACELLSPLDQAVSQAAALFDVHQALLEIGLLCEVLRLCEAQLSLSNKLQKANNCGRQSHDDVQTTLQSELFASTEASPSPEVLAQLRASQLQDLVTLQQSQMFGYANGRQKRILAFLLGNAPPHVAPIPPPGTVPKARQKEVAATLPRPVELPQKKLPRSWAHPRPGVPARVVLREEGTAQVPVLEVVGSVGHVLDLQSGWEHKDAEWKEAVTGACDRVRAAMKSIGSPLKGGAPYVAIR